MTAKQKALLDMTACGVSIAYILAEKAILAFTSAEGSDVKPDFRKFNGGYHPKKRK